MKWFAALILGAALAFAQSAPASQNCVQENTVTHVWVPIPCPPPVAAPQPAPPPHPKSQIPNPPPAPTYPQDFVAAGGAYSNASTPGAAGWASYAKLVSSKGPVYSYTTWDVTSSAPHQFVAQTSARTGMFLALRDFGWVVLGGLGDAGVATAQSNAGFAASGRGLAVFRIGKTWNIVVGAGVLKSAVAKNGNQLMVEIGVGRSAGQ